jgi:hypothetical protein
VPSARRRLALEEVAGVVRDLEGRLGEAGDAWLDDDGLVFMSARGLGERRHR